MTSSKLTLEPNAREELLDHVREGASRDPPAEVCGILAGTGNTLSRILPVSNVADEPRVAYELDPQETLTKIESVEESGDSVLGFYHSHPESAPVPSATDREQASWPGYVYLICSPDGRMNAYEWTADVFEPLEISR
ncbi:desampylase [Haloferax namakaokahaiae]|uniref:Desampylase n=1 Tax=Haloferax namakaokahaiae TaxID=1748331 RepID=A0ABD5ZAQ6_9EURY